MGAARSVCECNGTQRVRFKVRVRWNMRHGMTLLPNGAEHESWCCILGLGPAQDCSGQRREQKRNHSEAVFRSLYSVAYTSSGHCRVPPPPNYCRSTVAVVHPSISASTRAVSGAHPANTPHPSPRPRKGGKCITPTHHTVLCSFFLATSGVEPSECRK
jgi:hypothetical protein